MGPIANAQAAAATALERTPLPTLHCQDRQNPHTYQAASLATESPVGVGPVVPDTPLEGDWVLAQTVVLHDGSTDCKGEGADLDGDGRPDAPVVRELFRDRDREFGVGGGFFPADHHGAAFEVFDEAGAHVGFTVGADEDGDGVLGSDECRERFIRLGATTCPPGADGGWWVVLHPRVQVGASVSDPPTAGRIVSGPLSQGSQRVGLPILASVLIEYDGPTRTFTLSSPGGWICTPFEIFSATLAENIVHCEPPSGMDWFCQNWNIIVLSQLANGAAGPVDVSGNMECLPHQFAYCGFVLDAANPIDMCPDDYLATGADQFYCTLRLSGPLDDIQTARQECFNDP